MHPALEDITVEGILHVLADPVRAAIYADIVGTQCTHTCTSFLNVSDTVIPKSTLSQHFKALREAGLIRSERRGVEMHNTSRCAEVNTRFPGLLTAIVKAQATQSANKTKARQRKRAQLRLRS